MSDLFFGRYFKCCAPDRTVALIPARHRDGKSESASLQIITDDEAHQIVFPIGEYADLGDGFGVRLGDSLFEKDGITLDVRREDITLCGSLRFGALTPPDGDVMGPFRFVPFLQCRHSVYSQFHTVDGVLTLNGVDLPFERAMGYIEGDRGRSFPEKYVWTHAFSPEGDSLMLSVATIPLGPFGFTGVISTIRLSGRNCRFATYNGAKIEKIGGGEVVIRQGRKTLTARLIERKPFALYAPDRGDMVRTIRESAACKAYYRLTEEDRVLLEFETERASFEYEYPEDDGIIRNQRSTKNE